MINCPKCGNAESVALVSSILCPNSKCLNYDKSWQEELATEKIEAGKKSIKQAVEKLKLASSNAAKNYILDPAGNKIYITGTISYNASNNPTYTYTVESISSSTTDNYTFSIESSGITPTITTNGNDVYLFYYY